GMPTAFIAEYGEGRPVIGVLGGFDALPGLSQTAQPVQQPIEAGTPGHACGHHLFGVGSAAAAIAVAEWLRENRFSGTIRYHGTPAEEGGGGKSYLVTAGLFDDVEGVVHWPPLAGNGADAESSGANMSA